MVKIVDKNGKVWMTLDEVLEKYHVTKEELDKAVEEGKVRTKTFHSENKPN